MLALWAASSVAAGEVLDSASRSELRVASARAVGLCSQRQRRGDPPGDALGRLSDGPLQLEHASVGLKRIHVGEHESRVRVGLGAQGPVLPGAGPVPIPIRPSHLSASFMWARSIPPDREPCRADDGGSPGSRRSAPCAQPLGLGGRDRGRSRGTRTALVEANVAHDPGRKNEHEAVERLDLPETRVGGRLVPGPRE